MLSLLDVDPEKPAPPTLSRQELIERLERSLVRLAADHERLGTPVTALKKLTTLQGLIDVVKGQPLEGGPEGAAQEQPAPAAPHPAPETAGVAWRDLEALLAFYEDAMDAIQLARYSVRFGKPLAEEPRYPREQQAVFLLLRRLLDELRGKSG